MWYEFSIPADSQRQREIIRQLKNWIKGLEERKLVQGFAFNHYSGERDEDKLKIRFNDLNEPDKNTIRNELRNKLMELGHSGHFQENIWRGREHILRAYELGSRCAFLCWELIERGRLSKDYISNFIINDQQFQILNTPLQFQHNFNHGIMNSLGIHKKPNEQIIHLFALMESTNSKTSRELCENIQRHPIMSRLERRTP